MDGFLFLKRSLNERTFWHKMTAMLFFLCLVGIAVTATGQFLILNQIPITPSNDLARHVVIAENFFAALRSGQILPRLQELFPAVIDIPVFQYYGSMSGFVALPGILIGMSVLKSLLVGVLFFRIAAVVGVYWIAKLLGGNRTVSLLSSLVYLMAPYVISNLYGRVAIPEALAHCELPFLVLGLLFGLRGSPVVGIIMIAVTILLLSLTHPIFLLYGCIALIMMIMVSFSRNVIITGLVGLAIGILLSTIQWYPALISQSLLPKFSGLTYSDIKANSFYTSARGLFSFPVTVASRIVPPGVLAIKQYLSETKYLYLTPGILTLPVLCGLLIQLGRHREKRTEKLIILIPGLVFLCLSFDLFGIYRLLPNITMAVQFPYRLLAFVALFTAISLPILFSRLTKPGFVALAMLVIGQSYTLIFVPTYTDPLLIAPNELALTYPSTDYIIVDNRQQVVERDGDGWMRDPSLIKHFTNKGPTDLWLAGYSIFADQFMEVWIAEAARPKVPLTGKVKIPPGQVTVRLPLPDKSGDYILVPSRVLIPAQDNPLATDQRPLSFNIQAAGVIPRGVSYCPGILERSIDRKKIGPYSRRCAPWKAESRGA